jgi:coenzyme F420 hydrogenase subunit beta
LVIGIFCGFNLRQSGTHHLLRKLKLNPEDVVQLEYRAGPWPGGFRVMTQEAQQHFIPKHGYTYVHLMHAPQGCWFCPDLTAEHADISVGDYWADEAQGYSLLIGRTEDGQTLLSNARTTKDIAFESISYDQALASHHHLLDYKKRGVQVRRRLSGCEPVTGYRLPSLTAGDWLSSAAFYGLMRFGSGRVGRWIISLLPLRFASLLSERGRALFRKEGTSSVNEDSIDKTGV